MYERYVRQCNLNVRQMLCLIQIHIKIWVNDDLVDGAA